MADELVELQAAIAHELELAQSGDGYEPEGVAEEIVRFYAAPVLAAERSSRQAWAEEVERLRREVEFEANPDPLDIEAGSRDNLRYPLCACVTDEQAVVIRAGGFSRPVCTVHPEGDEA